MSKPKACIYCSKTGKKFCKAHIMPRGMGAFENQPTLKNHVCQKCDREIGKYEEQFMKCGPEGFLRAIVGIQGKSKSNPALPFRRKYAGHGPILIKVIFPNTNYEILAEPIGDGKNCQPLPQLVLINKDGNCNQILVTEPQKMTIKKLKKLIKSTNIEMPVKIWAVGLTEKEVDYIFNLLEQAGIFQSEEVDDAIQSCNELVKARVNVTFDKRYFQAIAKICFHYFLQFNDYLKGSETAFEPIRRFIRYGDGNEKSFVTAHEGYLIPELNNWTPKNYGHVVICNFKDKRIDAYVQFFIGPDYKPHHYHVRIGRSPLSIIVPQETFGHCYVYHDKGKKTGYQGKFDKLGVSTNIILPSRFSVDYL